MLVIRTIEKKKNLFESILKIVLIISVSACIIAIVFDIESAVFVSFILAWVCAITWILTYQIGLLKRYQITGKISVDGDRILDEGSEYLLNLLDQINLSYRGYKGLWIGRTYCYGDRNNITLINGTSTTEYNILIESKRQVGALQNVLEQWYVNDLNVKESGILNRDSILLRTNLSYTKRQQEIKRLSELKKTAANTN